MFRKLLLVLFFYVSLFGYDKIYFLPDDSKKTKEEIVYLLENAKTKIDIAMYNFSYEKFLKALKKAHKNGVQITIIYEKSDLKFPKEFKLIKPKRKQHIKLAIIDDKIAVYGSSNWTKDSFNENYELLNITNDKEKLENLVGILKKIKEEN